MLAYRSDGRDIQSRLEAGAPTDSQSGAVPGCDRTRAYFRLDAVAGLDLRFAQPDAHAVALRLGGQFARHRLAFPAVVQEHVKLKIPGHGPIIMEMGSFSKENWNYLLYKKEMQGQEVFYDRRHVIENFA